MSIPDDVEEYLRLEFANRAEPGMVAWRWHQPGRPGCFYCYEDTVAISHMIMIGWSVANAIKACGSLIKAVPHVPGIVSSEIKVPDLIYSVGYSRLADGSLWEILGDSDLPHAEDYFRADTAEYGAAATRCLERSAERIEDRLRQLVTVGDIDESGCFRRGLALLADPLSSPLADLNTEGAA